MRVKLAAVMALAAVILVLAAYLFGMSWGSPSTVHVHRPLAPATNAVTPTNLTDTGLQKH